MLRSRRDVRLLGTILGDVIQQQAGAQVFELVEQVRHLAKLARGGDDAAFNRLGALLSGLSPADSQAITRAFSHFLNLANIAEQHHRIRRPALLPTDDRSDAAARLAFARP